MASLNQRFTRLRTTALPILRLTEKANRLVGRSLPRLTSTSIGLRHDCPSCLTTRICALLFRRCCLFNIKGMNYRLSWSALFVDKVVTIGDKPGTALPEPSLLWEYGQGHAWVAWRPEQGWALDSQSLPALESAALEYVATASCTHSGAKTVDAHTAPLLGLPGALGH
jgi:hypothetical protein